MIPYKILLVNNHWKYNRPVTYLSWLIRSITGEYNHIAIEVGGEVFESVGQGVVRRSKEEWFKGSDRTVLEMIPNKSMSISKYKLLKSLVGKRYGYTDLIRVGWHYILTRKLGLRKDVPFNGKGYICSELATLLLDINWFIVPNDFQTLSMLKRGNIYQTKREI